MSPTFNDDIRFSPHFQNEEPTCLTPFTFFHMHSNDANCSEIFNQTFKRKAEESPLHLQMLKGNRTPRIFLNSTEDLCNPQAQGALSETPFNFPPPAPPSIMSAKHKPSVNESKEIKHDSQLSSRQPLYFIFSEAHINTDGKIYF